jgi:hypothetical protein
MHSQLVYALNIIVKLACPLVVHMKLLFFSEPALGHLCYHLTDVLPQPNSLPDCVTHVEYPSKSALSPILAIAQASFKWNKQTNNKSSGTSRSPRLPLVLHILCQFTKSN